jgi:2-polyprenyl-6-methoxyphenol hydroxylase-like FAD-dependent oxidoreductase
MVIQLQHACQQADRVISSPSHHMSCHVMNGMLLCHPHLQNGSPEVEVKARVVIGADGNQSAVREAILGVGGVL